MEATDQALLHEFAARRCEKSFRQLVDRHVAMVFAVSERVTNDRSLAEDIAQSTFAKLAEKAPDLGDDTVVAGWLYHTARNLAMMAVRSDVRRRQREEIAAAMNINEPGPNVVAEHLESAMDQLKPEDRDALVLRFFEDRSLRDIGLELGLSEDAARMRVNRSLEKLRGTFGKLGIAGSAAWLVATLPVSTSAAVPVGLGASITTAVLSGTAIATTAAIAAQTTSSTMNLLNIKTTAAVLAAAAVTGSSTYLVKERQADRLRADYESLNESKTKLANEYHQSTAAIQLRDDQIEQLRKEISELPRLRGEVDKLNRDLSAMNMLKTENKRLQDEVGKLREHLQVVAIDPAADRLAEITQFLRSGPDSINDLRFLGLVMRIYANDHKDLLPSGLNSVDFQSLLAETSRDAKSEEEPLISSAYDPKKYEQIYFGTWDGVDPNTVLVRQREPVVGSKGSRIKSYTLADGAVETVTESMVGGSFEQFERNWTANHKPILFVLAPR